MSLARANRTPWLLEIPTNPRKAVITSNAQARNAFGTAAQDIVCVGLELQPIQIDGSKTICYDAENWADDFFEIKSVKKSGKIVCYDWRMKKEANSGERVFYAIMMHNVSGYRDGATLVNEMARRGITILLASCALIHRLALLEPLNKLKQSVEDSNLPRNIGKRNGYSRKGYKDGYRNLSVAKLRKLPHHTRLHTFTVHGIPFNNVPILYFMA